MNKMEWHNIDEKPKNGEKVLVWFNVGFGDEYELCDFFEKGSIIEDDYSIDDKNITDPNERLLEFIFNPENRGRKVVQKDSFCFLEVNEDTGLMEWKVCKVAHKWARIYSPNGEASTPREIEMFVNKEEE